MVKRWWKVLVLCLSHLVVGMFAFSVVTGAQIAGRFRLDDPMYRIGLQLTGGNGDVREASFDEDLETLSRGFPTPLADVIRLMKHLKDAASETDPSLIEAERLCRTLAWQKCDRQTLLEMKRTLTP